MHKHRTKPGLKKEVSHTKMLHTKMLSQLMWILVILPSVVHPASIPAQIDDDLRSTLKTHFQDDNKLLIEALDAAIESDDNLENPRGFDPLNKVNGSKYCDDLMSQLTMDQKKIMIEVYENDVALGREDLEQLPVVWQRLTLKKIYHPEAADDWKQVLKNQNQDLSLLYNLGRRMMGTDNKNDEMKIIDLLKPDFEKHFNFLGSHFREEFIKFLTMDKIIAISKNDSLSAIEKANTAWTEMKPGQKEAWYTLFKTNIVTDAFWEHTDHVDKYGHVLSGATLEDIAFLNMSLPQHSQSWLKVIETNQMNPLRIQEVWSKLNEKEMTSSFSRFADKLDLDQIMKYHMEQSWLAHAATHQVEEFAFMSGSFIPFENILLFSKLHQKDINDIKKLVVGLTIPELEEMIIKKNLKIGEQLVDDIVSDRFTAGQLKVLYNIKDDQSGVEDMPVKLLSAMPSSTIESLDDKSRQQDLIKEASFMLQSQVSALRKKIWPQLWEKNTLELALSSYPELFKAASPAQFRENMDIILNAFPGEEEVEEMERQLRNLPNDLQTSWLETAFDKQKKADVEYWNTTKLLDHGHSRTAKVILGLNCQQIQKIRPSDTMLVLTAYQNLMDMMERETDVPSHIPKHVRKCWAKKIRTYLKMKSMLVEDGISREVDLLSLLNTGEIKTIGGEILLTWGADILTTISSKKVQNEVIISVGALPPTSLINNAVNFTEVKDLANANILMTNTLSLGNISRYQNLFPYIDSLDKKMNPLDFKLFVESLRKFQKCICVDTSMRNTLRDLIFVSFEQPELLSALDLAQLGDLLIVLNEDDMSKLNPASLRRANSQLVRATSYHHPVTEFLSESKPIPFHEACRRWLGANEATEFELAWRRLSKLYVYASFQAIDTIDQGTADHSSRRRKRDSPDMIDSKELYKNVNNLLRERYQAGNLTENQKQSWGKISNDGQSALARETLKILDLLDDNDNATKEEVSKIITRKKSDGSITEEKEQEISEVTMKVLLKMVQEFIKELHLVESDLNIDADRFRHIASLDTSRVEESYEMYKRKSDVSSTLKNPVEVVDFVTEIHPLQSFLSFNDATRINCNVLRAAGNGAQGFNPQLIKKMETSQVEACMETLGSLMLDSSTARSVWMEVKKRVFLDRQVTSDEMILLGSLLPTVAKYHLDMLDLTRASLEGISLLGRYLYAACYDEDCDFSEVPNNVIQKYVSVNNVEKFTSVELESFGQLLCGFSADHWDNFVDFATFREVHFVFNTIDCKLGNAAARASLEKKVLNAYNSPSSWTPSDVSHLGWLVGSLSPDILTKIAPASMEGVSGSALRMWTPAHWKTLNADHIKHIGPHAISMIQESSLPRMRGRIYFKKGKRNAFRSVASEGYNLKQKVDQMITRMEKMDSNVHTHTHVDELLRKIEINLDANASVSICQCTYIHFIVLAAIVTLYNNF